MTTRSVFAIALLPAVAALALAGCASPAPSPTVTVTTTTTASPEQPTTSPTTEPSAEGACDVNELSISLGEGGVGAGQTTLPLIFTNTGSVDCEIGGFPGVSLVGEAGVELAAPATRSDDTPATVSLAPGATGTATLIVSDPGDTEGCTVAPAQGLRIYPPNSYDAIYLETSDLQGCTEPTVNVMSIGPVVAD